jgi:hypothetical protein
MTGKGPRHERETVIIFNEEDAEMSIWTASEAVDRRLRKAGFSPSDDSDRHSEFKLPKSSFKWPRQPSQARAEQGRRLAASRKAALARPDEA